MSLWKKKLEERRAAAKMGEIPLTKGCFYAILRRYRRVDDSSECLPDTSANTTPVR
jgi:hypothetical protein